MVKQLRDIQFLVLAGCFFFFLCSQKILLVCRWCFYLSTMLTAVEPSEEIKHLVHSFDVVCHLILPFD